MGEGQSYHFICIIKFYNDLLFFLLPCFILSLPSYTEGKDFFDWLRWFLS